MRLKENQVKLLPHVFKLVGWSIVLLVLLSVIAQLIFTFQFVSEYKEIKSYFLSLFTLGLLFIAWSKEKMEDERTRQMKINALAASFIFGAIYAIATPILQDNLAGPVLETTGLGLMNYLLFLHVSLFYVQKYNDWYDERKG